MEVSMRAVGYIRVSRVGGREGDSFISPQLQREQIEAVARREGLEVAEVIEELDASGGDASRPGWPGDRNGRAR
jgi:DNA invertase Pin-like site-specific DNA recombinase